MIRRICLVAALIMSVLPGAAFADVGGPPIELTYVHRRTGMKAGAKLVSQKVPCPRGTKVLGGGSLVIGSAPEAVLHTTAPFDSDDRGRHPDDGWLTVGSNLADAKRYIHTWAVCASGVQVSYTPALVELVNGWQQRSYQPCPAGQQVTGGGVAIKHPKVGMVIESTGPLDGADADPTRDDGWEDRVFNGTTTTTQFLTTAICITRATPAYVGNPVTIEAGTDGFNFVSCPTTSHKITGGGFSTSEGAEFVMSGNHPDALNPWQTWIATAYNDSSVTQNVVVWAICLPS